MKAGDRNVCRPAGVVLGFATFTPTSRVDRSSPAAATLRGGTTDEPCEVRLPGAPLGLFSLEQRVGTREIQGYHRTVLEAVYHVVGHFSMHTGQIIMVAKMRTGRDLGLWQPVDPRRS